MKHQDRYVNFWEFPRGCVTEQELAEQALARVANAMRKAGDFMHGLSRIVESISTAQKEEFEPGGFVSQSEEIINR